MDHEIEALVLHMAKANRRWGYDRVSGVDQLDNAMWKFRYNNSAVPSGQVRYSSN